MKTWVLVVPMLVLLTVSATAYAAAPAKAPAVTVPAPATFSVEGKVLQMAKGRFQVQVIRVEKTAGLKAGQKIWIQETATTRILQAGKTAKVSALKVGARVEVSGNIMKTGTTSAYNAVTVQIVSSR